MCCRSRRRSSPACTSEQLVDATVNEGDAAIAAGERDARLGRVAGAARRTRRSCRATRSTRFANGLSWFILLVMPPAAIALFWIVHVLPQKIGREAPPSAEGSDSRAVPAVARVRRLAVAVRVAVGLHAPSIVAMATGTEKHEDYFVEHADQAEAGEIPLERVECGARRSSTASSCADLLTPELRAVRDRLKQAEERRRSTPAVRGDGVTWKHCCSRSIRSSSG